jgi:hypothetical protein
MAPAAPAPRNQRKGSPARNITTTAPKQIASAVPRSGWSITKAAGKPTSPAAGTMARQLRVSPMGNTL